MQNFREAQRVVPEQVGGGISLTAVPSGERECSRGHTLAPRNDVRRVAWGQYMACSLAGKAFRADGGMPPASHIEGGCRTVMGWTRVSGLLILLGSGVGGVCVYTL